MAAAVKIKICGITGEEDARMASGAGADYLGVLVNVRISPRSIGLETASRIMAASAIPVIVLTYDHSLDELKAVVDALHPSGVQLAGNESYTAIESIREAVRGELWKSLHLPIAGSGSPALHSLIDQVKTLFHLGVDKIILDTALMRGTITHKGGTGVPCDWSLAAALRENAPGRLFLAGGINPDNVQDALLRVRPYGIDVSSGVESSPGRKDPALVSRLIEAAKIVRPT